MRCQSTAVRFSQNSAAFEPSSNYRLSNFTGSLHRTTTPCFGSASPRPPASQGSGSARRAPDARRSRGRSVRAICIPRRLLSRSLVNIARVAATSKDRSQCLSRIREEQHNECPIAVGRRNFLFAGSDSGDDRAAAMYSLIATCKLSDTEPRAYLCHGLSRIADHPTR
jgi:hypothetical protein